tara:strand:+ start:2026 stop:2400 length:375 start_codon:yes stop_codon:yes gene_type:complete
MKQTKIPMTLTKDGELRITENLFDLVTQGKPNWKLVRKRDDLTKHSVDVMWIEFKEDGTFKAKHTKPAIGRSLMMSPFNQLFTWQTTTITEIIKERFDGYVMFKTENSTYELSKIYSEPTGNPV